MMDAVYIARYMPGLGDPFDLTMAQWNAVLDRLRDVMEKESPPGEASERAKQNLRRNEREKRRMRARESDGAG